MAACLVIGGAGFIGSHLVDALVARGDKVRVLDDLSTGTPANLVESRDAIELTIADVNAPDVLEESVRGVDHVFHFMEPSCVAMKDHQSTPGGWANAADTLNILKAARAVGVRRVIFASSGTVYGSGQASQQKESDPTMPVSPGGFAKQAAENQCAGFTLLYGFETVRLRFFDVYGPRQLPSSPYASAIPTILRSMLAGKHPVIPDSPFEHQDLLYVADAVHATVLAAEASRVAGKVYNIARGRSVSLVQVVNAANQILGKRFQPIFSDFRTPMELARGVDIARAETELGFCPSNDLRQGLERFIDYLKREREATTCAAAQAGHSVVKDPYFLRPERSLNPGLQADATESGTPDPTLRVKLS